MKTTLTAIFVGLFSSAAFAHNSETTSSVQASLAHQLTAPEHVLPVAVILAAAVYVPVLYRHIRNRK